MFMSCMALRPSANNWRRRDSKLLQSKSLNSTEAQQNPNTSTTITCTPGHWEMKRVKQDFQIPANSQHMSYTPEQKKCAVYVPTEEIPLDLKLVCNAWGKLPKLVRKKIVGIILDTQE